jgi:ribosomal protein S18 acetylase RimI-like enzyme
VVAVREARPEDAEAVLALMAGLGRPAIAPDADPQGNVFLDHLGHPDAVVFVAELQGGVVGAASLWFRPRLNWTTLEAWIPDLYVDPAHRRRRAARALLDACAAAARGRGCHRLVLESGHERAAAHQLYEAYGFIHGGRFYALPL